MAYSKIHNYSNTFIRGLTDFGHHYTRIKEHEYSNEHSICVHTFFLDNNNTNVKHMTQNDDSKWIYESQKNPSSI